MSTLLPKDDDGHPIPAVRFRDGGAHAVATSVASARNATAFNAATRVVSIYATEDVYLKFGDNTVTAAATDHFFPKGVYYDVSLGHGKDGTRPTHIAAVQVSAAGSLHISEKE